jgi:hypothetical protein
VKKHVGPYDEWELMALMHHSAARLTFSSSELLKKQLTVKEGTVLITEME